MLAHSQLDSHPLFRIVVLIWILLTFLVLLPTRAQGQFAVGPLLVLGTIDDQPVVSPGLTALLAVELLLLGIAMASCLILGPHWHHPPHPKRKPFRLHR